MEQPMTATSPRQWGWRRVLLIALVVLLAAVVVYASPLIPWQWRFPACTVGDWAACPRPYR